ncbi:cysteine-rich CWC family protein [Candidatus Colwellia aromaticivorans]|uniref:cysteine-rich CWC family protein n=1 Tax=Candidatus Colwellia aromaticivorans TaxID=2267621 RepID=UPI000DF23A4A|nr:cysteine-rich CWC family protein [Candidatus Colwellia aromaticivorans]
MGILSIQVLLHRKINIKKTNSCSNQQIDSDNINPSLCPLCNQKNNCGNVSACDSSQGCWCSDQAIQFPESLLDKIPSTAKNKACICKACALIHN